jgi:hypothetical protein
MSIALTTLSGAITNVATSLTVASASNITAPNYQIGNPLTGTASGVTYLLIEQEFLKVTSVSGTVIGVTRGENGSVAAAHATSALVMSGLATDFQGFLPSVKTAVPALPISWLGVSAPVADAAAITASGPLFHVTGSGTAITTMAPPAGYEQGGEITIIFDSTATWATGGSQSGTTGAAGTFYPFNASSTSTLTGIAVSFILDLNIAKWTPSHL